MRFTIPLAAAASLLLSTAWVNWAKADVAPSPPKGRAFVSHYLKIDNLGEYPGFALLVYDPSPKGEIRANRTFKAGKEAEQLLENQASWRSAASFDRPGIWALTAAQEKAWADKMQKRINEQREACSKRGEGCAHISRFVAHYPPPDKAIDCGVRIDIQTTVAKGQDRRVVDVYHIAELNDRVCRLQPVSGGAPSKADAPPSNTAASAKVASTADPAAKPPPADDMKARPTNDSGCACAIPGAPGRRAPVLLLVIAALSLWWARRQRSR